MRISDWSSDVCSSDLNADGRDDDHGHPDAAPQRRAYISAERELLVPGHDRRSGGNRPLLECYRRQWRPGKPVRLVQGQMGPVLADNPAPAHGYLFRSEEHTSELQSLMRISYAVFCLKKKIKKYKKTTRGHK